MLYRRDGENHPTRTARAAIPRRQGASSHAGSPPAARAFGSKRPDRAAIWGCSGRSSRRLRIAGGRDRRLPTNPARTVRLSSPPQTSGLERRLERCWDAVLAEREMRYPAPATVAELVGVLYTVEGSALGGQSIARCLRQGGFDRLPMRFFRDTANTPTLDGMSSWRLPMRHAPRPAANSAALTVASLFQAITRPRGIPQTPKAKSKVKEPVGMTGISADTLLSMRMIEPLPNCFSICAKAKSKAFKRFSRSAFDRFITSCFFNLFCHCFVLSHASSK